MLEMTRNLFEDVVEGTDVRYQRVDKQLGTVSSTLSDTSKIPSS